MSWSPSHVLFFSRQIFSGREGYITLRGPLLVVQVSLSMVRNGTRKGVLVAERGGMNSIVVKHHMERDGGLQERTAVSQNYHL